MSITPDNDGKRTPPGTPSADWVNRTCPACGTINPSRAAACWFCNHPLAGSGITADVPPPPVAPDPFKRHLALVVACCLTVGVLIGAVGIPLVGGVSAVPFSLFVCAAGGPAIAHLFSFWAGKGEGPREVLTFLDGAALVLVGFVWSGLIAFAAGVVFVATCTPISLVGPQRGFGPSDTWLGVSVGVGTGSAGVVIYLIVRALFRKRRGPESARPLEPPDY